jgi:hypothetical protein
MNVKFILAPIHIVPGHYVVLVADIAGRTLSAFDPFQPSWCIGDKSGPGVEDLMYKMKV